MDEALGVVASLEALMDEDLDHIKGLRMVELYESNKRKEALESRLRELESRWVEVADGLRLEMGLPTGQRSLSDVAQRMGSPWSETLAKRQERLGRAVAALRVKGQANIDLLKHSLLRIDESLKLITYFMNPGAVYGSGGKLDPPGGSGSYLSSTA